MVATGVEKLLGSFLRQKCSVGLEALIFDIQDVGSRYYTYIWTMALAACARDDVELISTSRNAAV